jgi:hypothetical protein
MGTTAPPGTEIRRFPGRIYVLLGLGLVLLGPVLYALQFRAKMLTVPWYVPVLTTTGAALALFALWRRPTVWRFAAFALCGLLAGAEWFFILSLSRVPAYTGPVAPGVPFPAFHTSLADGSTFDQDSLRGPQNTALVFFRGRW